MKNTLMAKVTLATMLGTLFQFLLLGTPTFAAGLANPSATSTVKTISATTNRIDLALTTATLLPVGAKIELTFAAGFTVNATWAVATDFQIDARTTGDTAAGSGQVLTITVGSTSLAAGSHTIQLNKAGSKLTNPATQAFYQVTVKTRTAAGLATADWGAVVVDIGNDGDVLVTAEVDPSLSFNLVDSTVIATEKNTCLLNTLTTGAVGQCDYRIKVGTNAATGYTVKIVADDQLNIDTAITQDINDVADGTVGPAGNEEYGIRVISLSSGEAGSTITAGGNFSTSADKLIPLTADTIISSTGPDAGDVIGKTTQVRHYASISAATGAGGYTQIVTYTATASF